VYTQPPILCCTAELSGLSENLSDPQSSVPGSSEGSANSLQHERVCIGCHARLHSAQQAFQEEERRREREVEETVKRLSALQAANGFFPDESDEENCTPKALVSFVQQYAVRHSARACGGSAMPHAMLRALTHCSWCSQDEAFLVQHGLNDEDWRARTAAWMKPQALQLYHDLLQRYREWDDGDVDVGGPAHACDDVEVAVYKYSSEEDSDGSDSEIIEFVTPRVRADADGNSKVQDDQNLGAGAGSNAGSTDSPRESWIQPVSAPGQRLDGQVAANPYATKGAVEETSQNAGELAQRGDGDAILRRHRVQLPASDSQVADLGAAHVRHVEAAQSNLAALHWRLLREDRADALGANLEAGELVPAACKPLSIV
jgi:hypothetical protein